MRATSLVTSMEQKKGSKIRVREISRTGRSPTSSRWASTRNRPHSCSPATTAIRQNSRHSTRRSI